MEKRETNPKIYVFTFWILIIFSIICILNTIRTFPYVMYVKNFKPVSEPVSITWQTDINTRGAMVCFNDYCVYPNEDLFNVMHFYKFNEQDRNYYDSPVKNIYIAFPENTKNINSQIKNISLYIGNNNRYYNSDEISKFPVKNFKITLEDSKDAIGYSAIVLPEVNTYNGILNHILSVFLSLFHSWNFFIIPYFWLFVSFLIYLFKKDEIKLKTPDFFKNPYIILGFIILLGIILRLNGILYYPLWIDEVYTKTVALQNVKTVFQDAGNPPLFFMLEYLFTKIFSVSDFALRFLPFLFGVLFIPAVYLILKNISYKTALFGAFLASVNIINIYHSQEARGYSMFMFLSVLGIYLLFKYLKNPDNKNLILYGICVFSMVSANYYLILLSLGNLIWGIIDLIKNKNNSKIPCFLSANIIAFLTFIPYFIISISKALEENFNGWISPVNKETFKAIIDFYFLNKYLFIILCLFVLINLVLCILFKKSSKIELNREKANLYIYLICSLSFVLICAGIISVFIKPILHQRVLLSMYGIFFLTAFITIVSVIDYSEIKDKFKGIPVFISLILLGIYFTITQTSSVKRDYNFLGLMNLIKNDAPYYHSFGYEINAIIPDYFEYLDAYPEIKKLDYIKWHKLSINNGNVLKSIKTKDYTDSDKAILYFTLIGIDLDNGINPKIQIYKANSSGAVRYILNSKG